MTHNLSALISTSYVFIYVTLSDYGTGQCQWQNQSEHCLNCEIRSKYLMHPYCSIVATSMSAG